ncbi:FtsP/CotA-like multicopper oxidase with cupredoxin domain [Streptomyces sp. B3I7]|uniref:multicopper oxidase family protein n=1 Tax=Streptomyces sp. B3I7 TaxID=3042269 RepID=UPI002787681D|nr:multicopper oxidase family protein [Streptomyces sp. B3I7]MDQ0813795.1 FtsP/CotA-like multicopper oxidase with cupredoxin domain [Streptomyces sp. B3I7]
MHISVPTRRALLRTSALAVAAAGAVAAARPLPDPSCSASAGAPGAPGAPGSAGTLPAPADDAKPGAGTRTVRLTAVAGRVDLGGRTVTTWTYGGALPGREIRVTAGETLAVTLANHLPQPTTLHWHGVVVPNTMDGVPGLTQRAVRAGGDFAYRFPPRSPGTYWYHSHAGVQADRGLYGPLIVEDPHEPLGYDTEWVVVLDDWLDGVGGRSPEATLRKLLGGRGSGMDMADDGRSRSAAADDGRSGSGAAHGSRRAGDRPHRGRSALLDGAGGNVSYPCYLVNGRTAGAPEVFGARPGQRVRIRLINASGDTAFRVALGGHRMTVTHTDGHPVRHTDTDALLLGMGERYDVLVTVRDGVFPLTALAEGKGAAARALLRTASGTAPKASARPRELDGRLVSAGELLAEDSVALDDRRPDRTLRLRLTGSMKTYDWAFDGKPYDPRQAHELRAGERVRLVLTNATKMWHPVHLHGHVFALTGTQDGPGARKDTAIVLPGRTVVADFDAENPGVWMLHCHNAYHQEAGMMTLLRY